MFSFTRGPSSVGRCVLPRPSEGRLEEEDEGGRLPGGRLGGRLAGREGGLYGCLIGESPVYCYGKPLLIRRFGLFRKRFDGFGNALHILLLTTQTPDGNGLFRSFPHADDEHHRHLGQ